MTETAQNQKHTPRKSKFAIRFRLWTLLFFAFIAAFFSAWAGSAYQQQNRELTMLEKLPAENAQPFTVLHNGDLETVLST